MTKMTMIMQRTSHDSLAIHSFSYQRYPQNLYKVICNGST